MYTASPLIMILSCRFRLSYCASAGRTRQCSQQVPENLITPDLSSVSVRFSGIRTVLYVYTFRRRWSVSGGRRPFSPTLHIPRGQARSGPGSQPSSLGRTEADTRAPVVNADGQSLASGCKTDALTTALEKVNRYWSDSTASPNPV